MFEKKDTTYNDLRKNSLEEWLNEMERHEDLAVRGGVKLTREYIARLEEEIRRLKESNELKNDYLRKQRESNVSK